MPDDPVAYGVFAIQPDHPSLSGHFPGNPIVPGVVLLDHILALLHEAHPGHILCGVDRIRFRRPVRPAQPIAVQARPGRDGALDFTGLHGGEVVLSGSARLETSA